MDLFGKKILSGGILYSVDNVCRLAKDGIIFPFSQFNIVVFDTLSSLATSSCVNPALTRAAASEICNVSNLSSPLCFIALSYHHFK